MEKKILGLLIASREAWDKVEGFLDPKDFSLEGQKLLELIKDYYARDDLSRNVDTDILIAQIERTTASPKAAHILRLFLEGLTPSTEGALNILEEVRQHKLATIGQQLGSLLIAGNTGAETDNLLELYEELRLSEGVYKSTEGEDIYHGKLIRDLTTESFSDKGLIELWPKSLNDKLDGGARPEHHILIFAPTEMGKTLVAINMVAGFLKQGRKVLYVGNEDPAADILMRLATRLTGMHKREIIHDPDKADEVLAKRNWDLFTLCALAPGTFGRINSLVRKIKPDIVVLDQLRNIDVRSDNRVVQLERAATEARNLAKRHKLLVVSITQAGDSASGKRVLTRGDVDFSNVGIPGQCDLMVGVGADELMEQQNVRVFSFPKNKISGDHHPLTVSVDPSLSKVIDEV